MSPLGRRRADESPEWAAPLDGAQFTEFREDLRVTLAPRGGCKLGEGFVMVPGHHTKYGLTNLIQTWAQVEPDKRADLVALHFDNLFEAEATEPPSPAELVPLIRPRVRNRDQPGVVTVPSLSQTIAEGLDAVLCVDLPSAVSNLTPEQLSFSGYTTPQLWELAISQIDDGLPVKAEDLGDDVTAFVGDSFFVASRVLALEHFAGEIPEHGALVAIPHRHLMIAHPIETKRVVKALNTMLALAAHFFAQGPGSIVPYVYWWRHDRSLLRIPSVVRDSHQVVAPPDELIAVLNALPAAPPDSDG
jgi:hypothetical protein